jgi:hypothetical protein
MCYTCKGLDPRLFLIPVKRIFNFTQKVGDLWLEGFNKGSKIFNRNDR